MIFVMLEHDNNNLEAQGDLCALKTPHLSSFILPTIEKESLYGIYSSEEHLWNATQCFIFVKKFQNGLKKSKNKN